jgi:hypothetical protein
MRNYSQYAGKPKLEKWLNIVPAQSLQLIDTAEQVRMSYDIDNATSYELDVIGRIVDQPRNFESYITIESLYLGSTAANLGSMGAQLKSPTAKISDEVSDDIYKILIRAKIAKNNSDGTIESVLQSMNLITGVEILSITEGDMKFGINFADGIGTLARFLLQNFDVIPRPQGVKFLGFTEEPFITRLGRNQLKSPSTILRNTQLTGAF